MNIDEIMREVWSCVHVLRDDAVGCGDYVEQITYLTFLKIPDGKG